jgi:hypothetical protein
MSPWLATLRSNFWVPVALLLLVPLGWWIESERFDDYHAAHHHADRHQRGARRQLAAHQRDQRAILARPRGVHGRRRIFGRYATNTYGAIETDEATTDFVNVRRPPRYTSSCCS